MMNDCEKSFSPGVMATNSSLNVLRSVNVCGEGSSPAGSFAERSTATTIATERATTTIRRKTRCMWNPRNLPVREFAADKGRPRKTQRGRRPQPNQKQSRMKHGFKGANGET